MCIGKRTREEMKSRLFSINLHTEVVSLPPTSLIRSFVHRLFNRLNQLEVNYRCRCDRFVPSNLFASSVQIRDEFHSSSSGHLFVFIVRVPVEEKRHLKSIFARCEATSIEWNEKKSFKINISPFSNLTFADRIEYHSEMNNLFEQFRAERNSMMI